MLLLFLILLWEENETDDHDDLFEGPSPSAARPVAGAPRSSSSAAALAAPWSSCQMLEIHVSKVYDPLAYFWNVAWARNIRILVRVTDEIGTHRFIWWTSEKAKCFLIVKMDTYKQWFIVAFVKIGQATTHKLLDLLAVSNKKYRLALLSSPTLRFVVGPPVSASVLDIVWFRAARLLR